MHIFYFCFVGQDITTTMATTTSTTTTTITDSATTTVNINAATTQSLFTTAIKTESRLCSNCYQRVLRKQLSN